MTYTLKRAVVVDPDPGRGMKANEVLTLEAGTALGSIPKHERDQLAPDHFDDGDGNTPKDWRSDERQQADAEHDERVAARMRGEEE